MPQAPAASSPQRHERLAHYARMEDQTPATDPEERFARRWLGACAGFSLLAALIPTWRLPPELSGSSSVGSWSFLWERVRDGSPLETAIELLPVGMAGMAILAIFVRHAGARATLIWPVSAATVLSTLLVFLRADFEGSYAPSGAVILVASLDWMLLVSLAIIPACAHRMRVGSKGRTHMGLILASLSAAALALRPEGVLGRAVPAWDDLSHIAVPAVGATVGLLTYLGTALVTGITSAPTGVRLILRTSRIGLYLLLPAMALIRWRFGAPGIASGLTYGAWIAAQLLAASLALLFLWRALDGVASQRRAQAFD